MKIEKNGICLRQMTQDDLEKIRGWRNDGEIAQYMAFRGHISSLDQSRWFRGVCERGDLYFIICIEGADIGLINLKDINADVGVAEAGIFIADKRYRNGTVSYRAFLALYDYAFESIGLNVINAHILDGNMRAIRFNQSFGYKSTDTIVNDNNRMYVLTKDDYSSHSKKLKNLLKLNN